MGAVVIFLQAYVVESVNLKDLSESMKSRSCIFKNPRPGYGLET